MKQLSFNNMAGLEGGAPSRACASACALYYFACSSGLGFLKRLASRLIDVYCSDCSSCIDTTRP